MRKRPGDLSLTKTLEGLSSEVTTNTMFYVLRARRHGFPPSPVPFLKNRCQSRLGSIRSLPNRAQGLVIYRNGWSTSSAFWRGPPKARMDLAKSRPPPPQKHAFPSRKYVFSHLTRSNLLISLIRKIPLCRNHFFTAVTNI